MVLEPGVTPPATYNIVPETILSLYGTHCCPYQVKRMKQAMEMIQGLEIETENGERDDTAGREE